MTRDEAVEAAGAAFAEVLAELARAQRTRPTTPTAVRDLPESRPGRRRQARRDTEAA